MKKTYCLYLRVSRQVQKESGLSLMAQRSACEKFIQENGGVKLDEEFVEVESGANDARPEMARLIELVRKNKEKGYVILCAKLDRIARSVLFLETLNRANVPWKVADYPELDSFTATLLMACAQRERTLCVERTRAALAAAKARGTRLGNPRPDIEKMVAASKAAAATFKEGIRPLIEQIRETGIESASEIARILNIRGYKTRTGKDFNHSTIKLIMAG